MLAIKACLSHTVLTTSAQEGQLVPKLTRGSRACPQAWLTVSGFFYTKDCETASVTEYYLEILKYQMKAQKLRYDSTDYSAVPTMLKPVTICLTTASGSEPYKCQAQLQMGFFVQSLKRFCQPLSNIIHPGLCLNFRTCSSSGPLPPRCSIPSTFHLFFFFFSFSPFSLSFSISLFFHQII